MNKSHLIGEDWNNLLESEFDQKYMIELSNKLGWLYKNHPNLVVPNQNEIFRSFKEVRLNDVKVIILGMSPYPSKIHACGRAFASYSKYIPKSLESVLYSIDKDILFGLDIQKRCYLDCINEQDYTLQHWVDQGVLLLNSNLTTEVNNPKAHQGYGWERFLSFFIRELSMHKSNLCFLAWGSEARTIMNEQLLYNNNHFYISCEHPIVAQYRNRKWNNNNCFKEVNIYLEKHNKEKISW